MPWTKTIRLLIDATADIPGDHTMQNFRSFRVIDCTVNADDGSYRRVTAAMWPTTGFAPIDAYLPTHQTSEIG